MTSKRNRAVAIIGLKKSFHEFKVFYERYLMDLKSTEHKKVTVSRADVCNVILSDNENSTGQG